MHLLRLLSQWAFVVTLATAVFPVEAKQGKLSKEEQRLFEWFDRLGIEDIKAARLVRIRTGMVRLASNNGGPYERHPDGPRGFLLWEKNGEARILLGDLTVATFSRHGKHPREDDYVGWRTVSMDAEVSAMLRMLSKAEIDFWDDRHDTYFDRLHLEGQAFALARYCAAQGRLDFAARLLTRVRSKLSAKTPEDLAEELRYQFGNLLEWRTRLAMADAGVSRKALADFYRTMAEQCSYKGAAEQAALLESMAAEDAAHPVMTAQELERLPPADQAAEWIFRLRDENTIKRDMWERPWPSPPTQGNGAVEKLTKLGHPAVPALLEALKDERPSRSVIRSERYGGGAIVREIQDLALEALTEIAGVNFFWITPYDGGAPNWAGMRLLADEWWKATVEKKGAEWFRSRIESGADGADYCLEALAKRYPEQLTMDLLPRIKDAKLRSQLIQHIGKSEAPEVLAFLVDEMKHGPTLGNRVAAAYPLRKQYRAEVLAAMSGEWKKILAEFSQAPVAKGAKRDVKKLQLEPDDPESAVHLMAFLLHLDSAEIIKSVQAAWPYLGTSDRMDLLWRCTDRLCAEDELNEPLSAETRDAFHSIFIKALSDDSFVLGISQVKNPRVAEQAAHALATNWPSKYRFTWESNKKKRAAQLANVRRSAAQ
jgi:hypothetical protein